ncbi:MAG: (2Fe-2S)-binding protein, partial [Pseudomonadota bacterium]
CDEPAPTSDYWAKAKAKMGWRVELAETEMPADLEAYAKALGARGEVARYFDLRSGQERLAFVEDGLITALIFGSRGPVAASRALISASLGQSYSPEILAGFEGRDAEPQGAIVCACMNVGVNKIRKAVEQGCATAEAVGEATTAGTNCGACKPEIAQLIAVSTPKIAAE